MHNIYDIGPRCNKKIFIFNTIEKLSMRNANIK